MGPVHVILSPPLLCYLYVGEDSWVELVQHSRKREDSKHNDSLSRSILQVLKRDILVHVIVCVVNIVKYVYCTLLVH